MGIVTNDMFLIKVNPDAENEYPLRMGDMVRCFPDTFLPANPDEELLKAYGVFVVQPTEKPIGDVVYEGVPELRDDTWYQTWLVRENTPEEAADILAVAKAKSLYRIEQWRIAQFAIGFPFLAPDGEIYHVQVRDQDRINILGRYTKAKEALTENPTATFEFRMYENVSVELSPEEMIDMGNQSDIQSLAGYKVAWGLKDQTRAATTVAEIPTIPDEMFTAL